MGRDVFVCTLILCYHNIVHTAEAAEDADKTDELPTSRDSREYRSTNFAVFQL